VFNLILCYYVYFSSDGIIESKQEMQGRESAIHITIYMYMYNSANIRFVLLLFSKNISEAYNIWSTIFIDVSVWNLCVWLCLYIVLVRKVPYWYNAENSWTAIPRWIPFISNKVIHIFILCQLTWWISNINSFHPSRL